MNSPRLAAALIYALPSLAFATTYYVDAASGNDSNPGTQISPWQSLTQVNGHAFTAGDTILFKGGNTWYGVLNITRSGTSPTNRITYSTYGSGEAVISGAYTLAGSALGNVYHQAWPVFPPQQVFVDNVRGTKKPDQTQLTGNGDWYYDAAAQMLYYYKSSPALVAEASAQSNPGDVIDVSTGATVYAPSIYLKSLGTVPVRLLFGTVVGTSRATLGEVATDKDWYYDATEQKVYFYNGTNTSVTAWYNPRQYAVHVVKTDDTHQANYVTVSNLTLKKTESCALVVDQGCTGVLIDNLTFLQWSDLQDGGTGALNNSGDGTTINACTFGQPFDPNATQADNEDAQRSSGFTAIVSKGPNVKITANHINHTSLERGHNGRYATGIKIQGMTSYQAGTIDVAYNTIAHVGGYGVFVIGTFDAAAGNTINTHHNEIEHTGQAGIALYQTRLPLAKWNTNNLVGNVYNNTIRYADRLGGPDYNTTNPPAGVSPETQGTRSGGIHFNDGRKTNTDASNPYIKWVCAENDISLSRSVLFSDANGRQTCGKICGDSDGIALDFGAKNVEVARNRVYNCDGKGIYMYNANNCLVHHNVVYGNDCGISVGVEYASRETETADGNIVVNNTLYLNYNGSGRGSVDNLQEEILLGYKVTNLTLKNNIIYPHPSAYVYYLLQLPTGEIDYNLVYRDSGSSDSMVRDVDGVTRKWNVDDGSVLSWRHQHSGFDAHPTDNLQAPGFIGPGLPPDPAPGTDLPFSNTSDNAPGELPANASGYSIAEDAFAIESANAGVNAGTPISELGTGVRDFEGGGIFGSAPDIGAYERRAVVQFTGSPSGFDALHYNANPYYDLGQGFKVGNSNGAAFRVDLLLKKQGSWTYTDAAKAAVGVYIYNNGNSGASNNVPTTNHGAADSVLVSQIGSSFDWVSFKVSGTPIWLNANGLYHVVLKESAYLPPLTTYAIGVTDNVLWGVTTSNPSPYMPTVDGCGNSDIPQSAANITTKRPNNDLNFKVFYTY